MRIVLISCGAKKLALPAKAKDMYISPLFKGAYNYAKKINADKIFILSAKYGLLSEEKVIKPYDETLNTKSQSEIKIWANDVINALAKQSNLKTDEFVFLAGSKYRKFIIDKVKKSFIPLEGMGIGKQLAFYKKNS